MLRPLTSNEHNLARWLCVVRHLNLYAPAKPPVDGCEECQSDTVLILDMLDRLKIANTLLDKIPKYSKLDTPGKVNYLNIPDGIDHTFYIEWSGDLRKAMQATLDLIDEQEDEIH